MLRFSFVGISTKTIKGQKYSYFAFKDPITGAKRQVYIGKTGEESTAVRLLELETNLKHTQAQVLVQKLQPESNTSIPQGGFIVGDAAKEIEAVEPAIESINHVVLPEVTPLMESRIVAMQENSKDKDQQQAIDNVFRGAATNDVISTPSGRNNPLENYVNKNLLSDEQMKEKYPNAVAVYPVLDENYLARLHDSVRRDGSARHALEFYIMYILGTRTKLILDVNKIFMDKDREKEALEKLNENEVYHDILDDLAMIDEDVGLRVLQEDLMFQSFCYGRAVQIPNYGEDGLPENIVPLSSFRLGEIYIDKKTTKFIGVKYRDFSKRSIILEKDCIHMETSPYNVTPNQGPFGMPVLEPINTVIESNRITNEISLPEASKRNYSPLHIIEIPSANTKEKLAEVRAQIKPAQVYVTNVPTEVKDVKLNVDLMGLLEMVKERDKKTYRDVGIPQIVGFQETQNRATAQYDLQQWTASSLQKRRTDLRDVYERQWYMRNIAILLATKYKGQYASILKEAEKQLNKTTANPQQKVKARDLNKELPSTKNLASIYSQAGLKVNIANAAADIRKLAIDELRKIYKALPFRAKMEFDNINFDNFVDKTAAGIALVQAGGLTWEFALELIGLPQYIDKMKLVWAEKELQEDLMFEAEMQAQKDMGKNVDKLNKENDSKNNETNAKKQQLLGNRTGLRNVSARNKNVTLEDKGADAMKRKFDRKTSLAASSSNI